MPDRTRGIDNRDLPSRQENFITEFTEDMGESIESKSGRGAVPGVSGLTVLIEMARSLFATDLELGDLGGGKNGVGRVTLLVVRSK